MVNCYNHVRIDNPNIPILCAGSEQLPFGKFFDSTPEDVSLDGAVTDLRTRDMYLPNFSIRTFEGKFLQDGVFVNKHSRGSDLLGSCVFFRGAVHSFLPGTDQVIHSFNGSQNFKYDPNNDLRHGAKAGEELHFMHFSFSEKSLEEVLPENERWSDQLRLKVSKRERILGERFAPIILAQEQALRNIFDCPLTGKLGYLLIETSIRQFMLLQMHELFHPTKGADKQSHSKRDVEIIHSLKEHLSMTFLDDHSLVSLARHFGTNTNKLMTMFKMIFGKSIFEYISERRMEHARLLLENNDIQITEVARTVGYKNANHFSAAFKRMYGLNPSRIREKSAAA